MLKTTHTCYWVKYWSTWCLCAGNSCDGSSWVHPKVVLWRTWCDLQWSEPSQTPTHPWDHDQGTQTQDKNLLQEKRQATKHRSHLKQPRKIKVITRKIIFDVIILILILLNFCWKLNYVYCSTSSFHSPNKI